MCCQPIWIPLRDRGLSLSNDKGRLVHDIHGQIGKYVPCGNCPECRAKRQNEWYVRFYCEDKYWRKNRAQTWFGTLTYDDQHLPDSRDAAVRDWQAFLKQLVRKLGIRPRFYCTSENGDENGRIHFHILLFNIPLDIQFDEIHKFIEDCWHRGFVQCCPASGKKFTYISKYVTKDFKNETKNDWDIIQCYSKRPPLGYEYASSVLGRYLNVDSFRPVRINGYPYAPTRLFKDSLIDTGNLIKQKIDAPKLEPPDYSYRNAVWRQFYKRLESARVKKRINNMKLNLHNYARTQTDSSSSCTQ